MANVELRHPEGHDPVYLDICHDKRHYYCHELGRHGFSMG
jgi:hypothetical protein